MVPVVRKRRRLVVAWSLCMVGACGAPEPGTLEIATTTSVQNSGLLDHMLPAFEREAGLRIHVHAAGSGRALQMLANRSVDAVISHAPEAERRLLSQHAAWSYRKIAYNWFVVVGPASDPADVRGVSNAVDAFRRIADSGAALVDTSKLGPQVGSTVPSFLGMDQFGKEQSLTSVTGPKGAMLVFFRSADW